MLSAAPLAVYEFENNGLDSKGFGPELTCDFTTGKVGSWAMKGSAYKDPEIVLAPAIIAAESWSFSYWAKLAVAGNPNLYLELTNISAAKSISVRVDKAGGFYRLRATTGVSPSATSAVVVDGGWHHVAFTWDGTNTSMYLDGVLLGTGGYPVSSSASTNAIIFETTFAATNGGDQLAFFDYALTPAEIAYIHNSGAGRASAEWTVSVAPVNDSLRNHFYL